jgi:hypothetical protein
MQGGVRVCMHAWIVSHPQDACVREDARESASACGRAPAARTGRGPGERRGGWEQVGVCESRRAYNGCASSVVEVGLWER